MKNFSKTGQRLWKKAKIFIPGGTMLFSKRPELYIPGRWPTYYRKAKGCYLWDLDNNKLIDMSTMSVGTNILGYANDKINRKVKIALERGNISSLNCPEEVYLAEELTKIHPEFSKVRFARTGGEANAIAIRIARAASKKDNVAFNGYHGWHDWYLSTNLSGSKNLDKALIKNLKIKGVPKNLKNSSFYFDFSSFQNFKKVCDKNKIGTVKIEIYRDKPPDLNILKKIRKYTNKKKIILIFDECTSGFRETFGGVYKKYKISPDILILGKALGNGYPVNAILGKNNIMKNAENTFISSTFWTERLGSVAALATLKEMKRLKSWKLISKKGIYIKKRWEQLSLKYNLELKIGGINAIPSFYFKNNHMKYKTLLSNEFLKNGFLASNSIYLSICHTEKIIKKYLKILEKIFKIISEIENGKKFKNYYNGQISKSHFRKAN